MIFVAMASCQDTLNDDDVKVSNTEDRKEKRGILLNLAPGFEGYSYLGPSSAARGMNYRQGYTPNTEFGI